MQSGCQGCRGIKEKALPFSSPFSIPQVTVKRGRNYSTRICATSSESLVDRIVNVIKAILHKLGRILSAILRPRPQSTLHHPYHPQVIEGTQLVSVQVYG